MSTIKSYPFVTKTQIRSRIETDDAFVVECLLVMLSRQTDSEQEAKNTVFRNSRGFMSSHALRGTTLGVKAQEDGLSAEETVSARSLVLHYTKQLAAHFRQEQIANDPGLAEAARMFSAN